MSRKTLPLYMIPKYSAEYQAMVEEFKERQIRLIAKYGVKPIKKVDYTASNGEVK